MDTTAKAQSIREKNGKLCFIKLNNFCSSKDHVKEIKKQAIDQRKYLQIIYLVKGLYAKYVKNFKLSNKKINNPIKNGQKI